MRCYRHTGFEHSREVSWLLARETEVGVPQAIERGQRARAAVVPGGGEALSEALEALACHVRHQGIAVAEMAIGRRRADAGLPGCLGEGEAGGTLLRNEVEGGADQRLTQVAVMIAAPPAAAVSGPAHAPGLAHSGPGDINPRPACAAAGERRSRLRARPRRLWRRPGGPRGGQPPEWGADHAEANCQALLQIGADVGQGSERRLASTNTDHSLRSRG